MGLPEQFVAEPDKRVCGTCGTAKPVEDFYKDGKDGTGHVKYRRDCKDCYKRTRITEANNKKKGGKK